MLAFIHGGYWRALDKADFSFLAPAWVDAGVSLAIVWGAMAERTRLWVYFAFGAAYTIIYSVVSHWIWSPDGWLFSLGMQDFAGSTVVHYQGALAGLAGALLLGPRLGKFDHDGKPNAIPGHNMAFTTLGVIILWFGWFGFNPGSTLSVDFGGIGFFAYVALNTNIAAAAGVLGAVITSWLVIKKPDLSMMLNGAIAALVAITAACAFVAPWAAVVIGAVLRLGGSRNGSWPKLGDSVSRTIDYLGRHFDEDLTVDRIALEIGDPSPVLARAREAAFADARQAFFEFAGELSVMLGVLLEVVRVGVYVCLNNFHKRQK